MKQFLQKLITGAALSVVVASPAAMVYAAPETAKAARPSVSGPQSKAPVEPGTKDAKQEESKGSTNLTRVNADGTPLVAAIGAVSNVDFLAPMNYCYRNLVYTPVKNTTAVTKYVQVRLYNGTGHRDIYTSIAAGATSYVAHYGVTGNYTAYLYVWNGSSYQYDESKTGTNTCRVAVTRVYNTGGWVQLKIQNTGTAYATQVSSELAPNPGSGTYTGTHYDYPVAGGAAIYRWFQVGTSPYAISSYTSGSHNTPVFFTGDL